MSSRSECGNGRCGMCDYCKEKRDRRLTAAEDRAIGEFFIAAILIAFGLLVVCSRRGHSHPLGNPVFTMTEQR